MPIHHFRDSSKLFKGKRGADIRHGLSIISRLKSQPVRLPGLPATILYRRKKSDGKTDVAIPAILSTPARMIVAAPAWYHLAEAARPAREALDSAPKASLPDMNYSMASSTPEAAETAAEFISDATLDDLRQRALAMADGAPRRQPVWNFGHHPAETVTHDYSVYRMLVEPAPIHGPGLTSVELELFLQKARAYIEDVIMAFPPLRSKYTPIHETRDVGDRYWEAEQWSLEETQVVDVDTARLLVDYFFQLFLMYLADVLYPIDQRIPVDSTASILEAFREWFMALYSAHGWNTDSVFGSADAMSFWEAGPDEIIALFEQMYPDLKTLSEEDLEGTGYPFVPFASNSIGFGLQLLYRQHWRLLQIRPSEIVKTIPLGPRQVERVSTKVTRTTRQFSSRESSTSFETSGESTNTNRSTHEIVAEAAIRTQIETGLDLSVPIEGIELGGKGSVNTDVSSNSRDTKSELNESVERTARRMRNEVKITVTTELQTSSETASSTELINPNDEIPITYVYSRLQSEYLVAARLHEVLSVAFVPERVPGAEEINEQWIREYDWLLGRNLLDESFREDLALVSSGNNFSPDGNEDTLLDWFKSSGEAARSALQGYEGFRGGDLGDVFSNIHDSYERQLEQVREERRRNSRFERSLQRLAMHIRQNIIHYMRAIWRAEDPEQRYLRYRSRTVCVGTNFLPDSPIKPERWLAGIKGRFVASSRASDFRRLSDIIDLTGPIGFHGNCAVYLLRTDPSVYVPNEALTALRSTYMAFDWTVTLIHEDAAKTEVFHVGVITPRFRQARYTFHKVSNAKWTAVLAATGEDVTVTLSRGGTILRADGLLVQLSARPANDYEFQVDIAATDFAMDPEERFAPIQNRMPLGVDEAGFWTSTLLESMVQAVPELARLWAADATPQWDPLDLAGRAAVRRCYYAWLVRRRHERSIVVEGENLLLDLDVGSTVALEEFKRLHRAVDVLKEIETANKLQVENQRRLLRVAGGQLEDPDIEQLNLTRIQVDGEALPYLGSLAEDDE